MTPWTVANQASLSMKFSKQEYWSGLPFPTPGDLPPPRIEPMSLTAPALAGRFFTTAPPGKPKCKTYIKLILSKRIFRRLTGVNFNFYEPGFFETEINIYI